MSVVSFKAERRTIKQGRPGAPPSDLVLRYAMKETTDTVHFPVYEWYMKPSKVLGGDLLHFRRGKISEIDVPWQRLAEPELTVERPRGYLVLPGWPVIEQKIEQANAELKAFKQNYKAAPKTRKPNIKETIKLKQKDLEELQGRRNSVLSLCKKRGLTQEKINILLARDNEVDVMP